MEAKELGVQGRPRRLVAGARLCRPGCRYGVLERSSSESSAERDQEPFKVRESVARRSGEQFPVHTQVWDPFLCPQAGTGNSIIRGASARVLGGQALPHEKGPIILRTETYPASGRVNFMSVIRAKLTRHLKTRGNMIHVEEKIQPIETDPAMIQMIKGAEKNVRPVLRM